ncbi:MAG TPA: DnaD domain protein [Lachnospiraceae bacterium]|nr:DnaD domain protein [Lachnospiraceae bacterium]
MSQITLCGDFYSDATVVSNQFIDYYMKDANDAQIKIYLYLLRCISGAKSVSVSLIADCFNYTEKDVVRALKYWEKQKLISLIFNSTKQLTGIKLLPPIKCCIDGSHSDDTAYSVSVPAAGEPALTAQDETVPAKVFKLPAKPSYSLDKLAAFKNRDDISQLLFIAEQYLNKTLSSNDISSLLYMYDSLGFDAELIEYLIEYCVNNRKKSIRFIETVANSWAEAGIRTVEDAKIHTSSFSKEIYEIFKALGLNTSRTPVEPELAYMHKWLDSFGFNMDIITEACSRTIMAIHSPSFEYTDTILSNWAAAGVRHVHDIAKQDEQFRNTKSSVKSIPAAKGTAAGTAKDNAVSNKFNSFSQRTYNYSELEKEILSN